MTGPSADGLLLIGHGSSRHPDGAREALEAHAARIRAKSAFGRVETAFLKGGTPPDEALAAFRGGTVHVVPHFMSDGYFVSQKIPALLGLDGRQTRRSGRTLIYHRPPALSPGFTPIALASIEAAIRRATLSEGASCLVVGHGSSSDESSAAATRRLAGALADAGWQASAVFVEQEPHFDAAVAAHEGPLVVAGFFAANGFHAEADVRAGIAARPATAYTGALGAEAAVADLIAGEVASQRRTA